MYLIRLDDASDHMNIEQWDRMERMLDENGVKPLVGIIPVNRDPMLLEVAEDPGFWEKARHWQEKGWRIALHGFEHLYTSNCAGINPVHDRSEFAGTPLDIQRDDDGTWIIEGPWLQRLMGNINFSDYESRMYFDKTLRESGLYQQLEEMGIQDGDTVSLYDFEFEYQR